MTRLAALVLATVLAGCTKTESAASTGPSPTASHAPSHAPTPPGAPPRPPHKKGGFEVLKAGPRPKVRDVTVSSAMKSGVAVQARAMVSNITPADGLRFAIRFDFETTDARSSARWNLGATRFILRRANQKERTLTFDEAAPPPGASLYYPMELRFDQAGLTQWGKTTAWKQQDKDLLAAPGTYTLRVEGEITMGAAKVPFSTPALSFSIAAPSDTRKELSELAALATRAVTATGTAASPTMNLGPIDDENDGRWFRFSDASRGYDVRIVDALLAPGGDVVAMQTFTYFSCVALGTPIATPRGPVPVERLVPGDTVWGYDTATRQRVETPVLETREATRGDLVDLDGLKVTPDHPVWADGRWVQAGDVKPGAALVDADGGAAPLGVRSTIAESTVVFDLSVGPPHDFFAGGKLVHNKAVAVEMAPGDPWRGLFLRATDVPAGK